MSQRFEDCARPLFVRCSDVGLDRDCIIFEMSENKVVHEAIVHMFEFNAINPEEMTSEMKWRIKDSVRVSRAQQVVPRVS
jgi:hypothetical protein